MFIKAKAPRGADLALQTSARGKRTPRPPASTPARAPRARPSLRSPGSPTLAESPRGRPPPRTARHHHEVRIFSASAPKLRVGLGLRGPRCAAALSGAEPWAPRSGHRGGRPREPGPRLRWPPAPSRDCRCRLVTWTCCYCPSAFLTSGSQLVPSWELQILGDPPSPRFCADVCSCLLTAQGCFSHRVCVPSASTLPCT